MNMQLVTANEQRVVSEAWHRERLAVAYQALAATEDLPSFATLIDQGEALRVAARAAGLSQQGINAWVQYKVECEVAAAERIAQLRADGRLVASGQHSKVSEGRTPSLRDFDISRQRASEWETLARLPAETRQAEYARADERGEVLSEAGLLRVAKEQAQTEAMLSAESPPLPPPVKTYTGMIYGTCPECEASVLLQVVYHPVTDIFDAYFVPPDKAEGDWFPGDDE